MHMNCLLDVEMYNKYPIGSKEWECLATKKRISYWIRTLTTGDFIVSRDEIWDQIPFKSTVVSMHESEVYYINWDFFVDIFDKYDLWTLLNKHSPPINYNIIGTKVLNYE